MSIDREWRATFRDRMQRFAAARAGSHEGVPLSIKIRATAGCFHRDHSTRAFELIDPYLALRTNPEIDCYQEHESGPELLVYLAVGTAGVTLAKSLIDLVTAIIKGRAEGIKRGDRPSEPLELIVRRMDERGYKEEIVLRVPSDTVIDSALIAGALTESLGRLLTPESNAQSSSASETTIGDADHE